MLIYACLWVMCSDPVFGDVQLGQVYSGAEETMSDPHFFDFSPNGKLYVVDRGGHAIHRWDISGQYIGQFGSKGRGPGEFVMPQLIQAGKDSVIVWDRANRFSIFGHDGSFQRSFNGPAGAIRRFCVVNDQLILTVRQVRDNPAFQTFELINMEGEKVETLKTIETSLFVGGIKGDNKGLHRAYGPESDIFNDKNGTIWFGFSETNNLYRLNRDGAIVEERQLKIHLPKPSSEEMDDVRNMSLTAPNGQMVTMKMMPEIQFTDAFEKAPYTHLHLTKNGLSLIRTPAAGNDLSRGYFKGQFNAVSDDGTIVSFGQFEFESDAQVIFVNGRALAFFYDGDAQLVIQEVFLKGRRKT